jgi:hypothetical protein
MGSVGVSERPVFMASSSVEAVNHALAVFDALSSNAARNAAMQTFEDIDVIVTNEFMAAISARPP